MRQSLCIPTSWDHPQVYRQIVRKVIAGPRATVTEDCGWLGQVERRSPLKGFDKCLWWTGGGSESPAMIVKDPWRVVRELGFEPSADC